MRDPGQPNEQSAFAVMSENEAKAQQIARDFKRVRKHAPKLASLSGIRKKPTDLNIRRLFNLFMPAKQEPHAQAMRLGAWGYYFT